MASTYLSSFQAAAAATSGGASTRPRPRPRPRVVTCHTSEPSGRRSACLSLGLGLATAAVLHTTPARAIADGDEEPEPANNGWWLTEFPLPVPKIRNKEINNGETGTRSFVKNGIYMADIGPSFAAHAYRVRSSAFDLLALEDLLGKEASNYVNKYLRLKATFIYYDFDKLITAADPDAKPPLLDLANRLFDSFEKLQAAVTTKDDTDIGSCYADTKLILQEVMTRMA
ncbi:Oxygen-evolving enhancer protein 3-1, chloroplastic [Hordeum vulgare]|uniref:Photosynthetic NDH subunit of subcomplex L3 n=1 Tax=Hordeum vulgare subsp. spontaneum TaxID=77009 RepID=UPI001E281CDE|nr:Oxygen-evolving enhancer protein 3-1, chloroplastic [Hordeum vulgare]7EU3_3 Chain 3, Photosynthetic NDH subunit of subcomplex L3 [Hordeum vulgare subsp. spontaneum]7F9O_c Chain c, Photosynthetic NDH subunit of subcomplex L2 [Hordeum vulgare subsp. spontaneum]